MRPIPTEFFEPPRSTPIDVGAALDAIPAGWTIAGMFLDPIVAAAKSVGATLPSARERYTNFGFYPLSHHVTMLVEACAVLYPELPLRAGLRKLGRAAPRALLTSTLGRVTLGSAEGVHEVLRAFAKTYAINLPPSRAEVLTTSKASAIVRMESVAYFLDSHHVGALEGTLRHAGVNGRVEICPHGPFDADFRCSWGS